MRTVRDLMVICGTALCLSLGLGWGLGGCATTGDARRDLIAQAAVVYGTAKVIENNPDYAPRIAAIAGSVRQAATGEGVDTVAAVMTLVRGKIDWAKLSPADTVLVNLLLEGVANELTARLGAGVLPEERALVVARVAGWIEQTALAYAPEGRGERLEVRG